MRQRKKLDCTRITISPWPLDQLVTPFISITTVFIYEQHSRRLLISIERLLRALALLLENNSHPTECLNINPSGGISEVTRLGTVFELFKANATNS